MPWPRGKSHSEETRARMREAHVNRPSRAQTEETKEKLRQSAANRSAHPKQPLLERFWNKVSLSNPEHCWIWKGCRDKDGYGQFRVGSRRTGGSMTTAHRVAWELTNGQIPVGLELHHPPSCPKTCVNPAHLKLVTRKEHCALDRSGANHYRHKLNVDGYIGSSTQGEIDYACQIGRPIRYLEDPGE